MPKSSSSPTLSMNSSARSAGRTDSPSGVRRSMRRAICMTAAPSSSSVPSRPGRCTLTMTGVPSGEGGAVDLRDRGAGDRRPVEGREHLGRVGAELGGDVRAHLGLRRRLGARAQQRQLVAPRARQHVAARRGDLAELDEDPAGLLQRAAHAAGQRLGRHAARHHAVLAGQRRRPGGSAATAAPCGAAR